MSYENVIVAALQHALDYTEYGKVVIHHEDGLARRFLIVRIHVVNLEFTLAIIVGLDERIFKETSQALLSGDRR
jgi:hypothetical protein